MHDCEIIAKIRFQLYLVVYAGLGATGRVTGHLTVSPSHQHQHCRHSGYNVCKLKFTSVAFTGDSVFARQSIHLSRTSVRCNLYRLFLSGSEIQLEALYYQ